MITNVKQLHAALHQLSSMVDMLEALQLDCQSKSDFTLFPLISEGYLHRIRDLNSDLRTYLMTQEQEAPVGARAATSS